MALPRRTSPETRFGDFWVRFRHGAPAKGLPENWISTPFGSFRFRIDAPAQKFFGSRCRHFFSSNSQQRSRLRRVL
eukprot:9473817-Pyramimonas_sp.AAC.1